MHIIIIAWLSTHLGGPNHTCAFQFWLQYGWKLILMPTTSQNTLCFCVCVWPSLPVDCHVPDQAKGSFQYYTLQSVLGAYFHGTSIREVVLSMMCPNGPLHPHVCLFSSLFTEGEPQSIRQSWEATQHSGASTYSHGNMSKRIESKNRDIGPQG